MASHRRPEIHPSQPDPIGAIDQFLAWLFAVLDDHHHAGVEILLRVIDIRDARALGRDGLARRSGEVAPGTLIKRPGLLHGGEPRPKPHLERENRPKVTR